MCILPPAISTTADELSYSLATVMSIARLSPCIFFVYCAVRVSSRSVAVPASEAVDSSAAALVSAFDVLSAFDELEELLSEQPAITAHDIISETRSAVIFFIINTSF